MEWIPVLEYLQMAGRAGRPEYESYGEAICLAKNDAEKEEIYEKYICGVPEDIYSKLAVEPVLRTYLLSLISSGIIQDHKTMMEFFSKTFWAFQFEDMPQLEKTMQKMLGLLEDWKFVLVGDEDSDKNNDKNNDFISAQKLAVQATIRLRATSLGRRVSLH